MVAYVKLRVFSKATEKYRAKLTTWSDAANKARGSFVDSMLNWPQPETVPELWFLMYNVETIILQLFTPKPLTHTYLDDSTHQIRMYRKPTTQMEPRRFMPLPKHNIHNNNALDRLFGEATKPEDASNEFERAT